MKILSSMFIFFMVALTSISAFASKDNDQTNFHFRRAIRLVATTSFGRMNSTRVALRGGSDGGATVAATGFNASAANTGEEDGFATSFAEHPLVKRCGRRIYKLGLIWSRSSAAQQDPSFLLLATPKTLWGWRICRGGCPTFAIRAEWTSTAVAENNKESPTATTTNGEIGRAHV